jgi:hypothetical protein
MQMAAPGSKLRNHFYYFMQSRSPQMTKAEDSAMQVASAYLRANPEASLDEIADVISQFGGLTDLGDMDGGSEFSDEEGDSGAASK